LTITAAIVLLAVIWFMTLYISLPIGMKSQGDVGEVAPGTPASAPSDFLLKRKLMWVTIIATPIWIAVCAVIWFSPWSMGDLDFYSDIQPGWQVQRDAAAAAGSAAQAD
tara:strand:+ start:720 stop:1046 length:327 start_codon:yes stop_codon:yes gene_type:complete